MYHDESDELLENDVEDVMAMHGADDLQSVSEGSDVSDALEDASDMSNLDSDE